MHIYKGLVSSSLHKHTVVPMNKVSIDISNQANFKDTPFVPKYKEY
jgi:hypothetical protein